MDEHADLRAALAAKAAERGIRTVERPRPPQVPMRDRLVTRIENAESARRVMRDTIRRNVALRGGWSEITDAEYRSLRRNLSLSRSRIRRAVADLAEYDAKRAAK